MTERVGAGRVRNSPAPNWDPAALALICLAAAVRIALWSQQRSLWIDEARLGLNIASRSYLDLLPPLDYDQAAPLLYLWIERLIISAFGVSEASLRLLALGAGIATVVLIYIVSRRLFSRQAALLATTMAVLSPTLIHYSGEVKQYAVEACASCAVVCLGLRWLDDPSRRGRWFALIAMGVITTWLATPAPFVLVGAGLAVVVTPGLRLYRRARLTCDLVLWWGGFLALEYLLVFRHAGDDGYLHHYWSQAFLTPGRPGVLFDLGVALRGVLWGPISALWGPATVNIVGSPADLVSVVFVPAVSIVIALFLVMGVRRLARTTGLPDTVLLLLPITLAFLASAMRMYPISARTTMYFMPTLIILVAAGIEELASQFRPPIIKWAILVIACLPLAGIAFRELKDPDPREHLRPLVASLETRRQPGEPIYVFAGAIPAWAMYTTDWNSPDTRRLAYLRRIARAGGAAFENAPARGRPVSDEGFHLIFPGRGGPELYGIPAGLEARAFGLTNPMPDPGWAENEARRIRDVASPGVWLVLSHFYGPEGTLLDALEVEGARLTYRDFRNGAALARYEFPIGQKRPTGSS